jgi:hypothetical protein
MGRTACRARARVFRNGWTFSPAIPQLQGVRRNRLRSRSRKFQLLPTSRFLPPQESATANSLGGRFSPTHYPKETAVQKIQVVVQKMQAHHSDFECKLSFGFECTSPAGDQRAPEYSLGRASNRKEYEKVRSMPWKTAKPRASAGRRPTSPPVGRARDRQGWVASVPFRCGAAPMTRPPTEAAKKQSRIVFAPGGPVKPRRIVQFKLQAGEPKQHCRMYVGTQ